jgi:hypothetical protein
MERALDSVPHPDATHELKFWLTLLCAQDWVTLPKHLAPVWLQPGGDDEYCTDKPLRVVMSCLEHVITRLGQRGFHPHGGPKVHV